MKYRNPNEVRNIYLYAANYCIRRLNSGDRNFIREAFELYKSGLENKTLLNQGILSSYTYKNVTSIGLALSEFEWVEKFLEDFKKHLHPQERDNSWRFNLAYYYFQQQKYAEAMRLLILVDFKDALNNFDARRLLLKCYYELKEFDTLISLLDSFERYIQRQKDVGYHRENYKNMIRFVKKMVDGNMEDKGFKKQLKVEIQNTKGVAERKWLLEKTS